MSVKLQNNGNNKVYTKHDVLIPQHKNIIKCVEFDLTQESHAYLQFMSTALNMMPEHEHVSSNLSPQLR